MYKLYTSKHCYIPADSLAQAEDFRQRLHASGYVTIKIVKMKD